MTIWECQCARCGSSCDAITDEPLSDAQVDAIADNVVAVSKIGKLESDLAALRSQNAALEQQLAAARGERERLPQEVLAVCHARNWSLHWTCRGAYLHLESSELVEAIRGKHGDPLEEAADVLIVLMSITEHAGIPWGDVLEQAARKVDGLKTKPRSTQAKNDCKPPSRSNRSENHRRP